MERRGNRFGTLVSKGVGKPYLAKWVCHGKVYYKSTGEVDKKKALKVLEKLTRPFREDDEADVISNLEHMLSRLKGKADPRNKLAVKDIWSEFEKTLWQSDLTDGTKAQYELNLKHMTNWMLDKVPDASAIDVKIAEVYLKELSEKVGSQGFNLRLSLLKRVWHALPSEYGLDKTVWDGFKKKPSTSSSREALTQTELATVVAKAGTNDMRLLLLIGIYTGLRIGDCANLKWSDIDLEANVMKVLPQKTKKHMAAPITIPLHPALKEALAGAKVEGEVYVSKANAEVYARGKLNGAVTDLFKKCGIETSTYEGGKKKLLKGFHSLRHTFVSMAINSGMSAMLVQRIVGHSTVNMTNAYFHENIDKMTEGVNALPDVVSAA